tara:strand:+ start:715 stop:1209 length:495 start_codon:yes stop_codon:yes gene_type:complete
MKRNKHPYWVRYSASENGSVYGSRGGELSPISHHTGYQVITVRNGGEQKQLRVHRFVWECCVGEIPSDKVINHKDGNKHNNSLDNLELVSTKENIIHSWEVLSRESANKGDNHFNSKITENQAKDIIEMCKNGFSNKFIGNEFGLHPNYISLIRHGKRWRHLPR